MPKLRFLNWTAPAALSILLPSCAWIEPAPSKAKPVLYEWKDDGGPGELTIHINLSDQTATYRRDKRVIGWSFVSTGKEGHSTTPGHYAITEKMDVKYSDRYGWISDGNGKTTIADATPATPVPPGDHYSPAPMYWWMRITTYGVGLHAGEIPRPGAAESHGCVRLPKDFAPQLYKATRVGTPVTITRNGPEGRPNVH